jgi:hypothetical protein
MLGQGAVNTAIHWAGPVLMIGAGAFGLTIVLISRQPLIGMSMGQAVVPLAFLDVPVGLRRTRR